MAGAKEGVVFARDGIENTGFAYAFSLIEGKYKLPVLFCLYLDGTTRYNELKRKLAPATYKSLTSALRGLVATASSSASSTPRCRRRWSTA